MEIELIKSSEETPENEKHVYVLQKYRYKFYKESSNQFKQGMKGRWQSCNGYGWDNISPPDFWVKGANNELCNIKTNS